MQKVLCLFFFLFSMSLHAQHDSLLAFLKASYEQEKSWQSGEIQIRDYFMKGDTVNSEHNSKLTFFHQNTEPSLFLLEKEDEGIYFTNNGEIEYAFRERRRQWYDMRFPDAYPNQFNYAFDELAINPYLTTNADQPYAFVQNFIRQGKDSSIHWDPTTRVLKIKTVRMKTDNMANYIVWIYTFDRENRLINLGSSQEITLADSIYMRPFEKKRSFSYSSMNEVPYISIIKQIKTLQSLPLQTVFKPEPLQIDSTPKIGDQFPNLTLMDVIGDQTHLADLYGPKVLIFFEVNDYVPDSLFSFIDTLEDQFPGVTFMLISQQNVDALYWYKRENPSINSFYLASFVEGLYLNGWPVWVALDPQNKILAENHGYQASRKNEFTEWIKGLYEVH